MRTRNHGSRFDGILKNEIASFWAVKARKLAISKPISPGKSILDQPFGWFFTADSLAPRPPRGTPDARRRANRTCGRRDRRRALPGPIAHRPATGRESPSRRNKAWRDRTARGRPAVSFSGRAPGSGEAVKPTRQARGRNP